MDKHYYSCIMPARRYSKNAIFEKKSRSVVWYYTFSSTFFHNWYKFNTSHTYSLQFSPLNKDWMLNVKGWQSYVIKSLFYTNKYTLFFFNLIWFLQWHMLPFFSWNRCISDTTDFICFTLTKLATCTYNIICMPQLIFLRCIFQLLITFWYRSLNLLEFFRKYYH